MYGVGGVRRVPEKGWTRTCQIFLFCFVSLGSTSEVVVVVSLDIGVKHIKYGVFRIKSSVLRDPCP